MLTTFLISAAVAVVLICVALATVLATRPAARRLRAAPFAPSRLRAGGEWIAARITAPLLVLAAGAATVFALAGLFAELADDVLEQDDLTALDRPVLGWLAEQRSPTMTAIQIGVTDLGSTPALAAMLVAAAAVVSLRLASWRPVIVAVIGGGGIGLLVWAIKLFIARARPDPDGRLVTVTGFSFPSGHSSGALVCFGLLAWLICMATRDHTVWATAWLASALLTVAVGLSRIYLGVHYPSDVLGGWILGGTWLIALAVAAFVVRRSRPAVESSDYEPAA